MKEYISGKIVAQLVGWLVGCRLFVGILLDSCKRCCYKNRARVKQVTEFRCVTCLQKLTIFPAFISRALLRYSV